MCCASIARQTVVALLAVLVAACGGGASEEPSASGAAGPGAAQTTSGADTSGSSAPQAVATCDLPGFADDALALVNDYRARGADCGARGVFGPAVALAWNTQLEQAAVAHSTDMATHDFFDHTGSDGSTMVSRVNVTGYSWTLLAENIAAGQSTVADVVAAWMDSPDHCENIMNPNLREIALACVRNDAAAYRRYWTMDLGTPR
jgi:uncharacterized protein YkwD